MVLSLSTAVYLGVGVVGSFVSFIYLVFNLVPIRRQMSGMKVLFLNQSLLCITLFVCQGLGVASVEQIAHWTTLDSLLPWMFIWLQAALTYNMVSIVFVLYVGKTQNRNFTTSQGLLATVFGGHLFPLVPLIPLAFYAEKRMCTDQNNHERECQSSPSSTSIVIASLSWQMFLHYVLPAVVSMVCVIKLLCHHNKYEVSSKCEDFHERQWQSFIKFWSQFGLLAAFFMLFALATVPQILVKENRPEQEHYYKLLFFVLESVTSLCVVFAYLTTILVCRAQLVVSKKEELI